MSLITQIVASHEVIGWNVLVCKEGSIDIRKFETSFALASHELSIKGRMFTVAVTAVPLHGSEPYPLTVSSCVHENHLPTAGSGCIDHVSEVNFWTFCWGVYRGNLFFLPTCICKPGCVFDHHSSRSIPRSRILQVGHLSYYLWEVKVL